MAKEKQQQAYIFIDNSNLYIRGKAAVASFERYGTLNEKKTERSLQELNIEYGELLKVLLGNNRELGADPFLVGSEPPSCDSLWKHIKSCGFEVQVFPRRTSDNKEKGVDVAVAVQITKTVCLKDPGVLIIVSGDADYAPVVRCALENKWTVEIWSWENGMWNDSASKASLASRTYSTPEHTGAAHLLKSLTTWICLDGEYKKFTYAKGSCKKTHRCEITVDDDFDASNSAVFQMCRSICVDTFAWWDWNKNQELIVYFSDSSSCKQFASKFTERFPNCSLFEVVAERPVKKQRTDV